MSKLDSTKRCRRTLSSLYVFTGILCALTLSSCTKPTAHAQTTYYVDATNGSDANSGTSRTLAWKTIAKVNAQEFVAGDSILFKRGQEWREGLGIDGAIETAWNGTANNHIIFDAYGTGPKPKFLGSLDKSLTTDWTRVLEISGSPSLALPVMSAI